MQRLNIWIRTVGDSSEWFWLFGLCAVAPVFLSDAGLLNTLVVVLSDPTPQLTIHSLEAPATTISTIDPVPAGKFAPTSHWFFATLAVAFALAGQCRAQVKFAPHLTIIAVLIGLTVPLSPGTFAWDSIPALFLGIGAAIQLRQRQADSPAWRHSARVLLAVASLWLLARSSCPAAGALLLAVATFGMGRCRRIDTRTIVSLVATCLLATLLGEDDSPASIARYVLFGAAVAFTIVQFGKNGRILAPSTGLFACMIALSALAEYWREEFGAADLEPLDTALLTVGWLLPQTFRLGDVNWLEVLGLGAALVFARWIGLIAWQNRKLIGALKASPTAPALFRDAFWASGGIIGFTALFWLASFLALQFYDAVLVRSAHEQLSSQRQQCPEAVNYRWTPPIENLLILSRIQIELARLETHRCLEYKIQRAIEGQAATGETINLAAKEAFASLWPLNIVTVPNCPSFFWSFPVSCYIERPIKKKINEKYNDAKLRAVHRFNTRADELRDAASAQTEEGGAYMRRAIRAAIDDDSKAADAALVSSNRGWAFVSFLGTAYLLLVALKLFLSVVARFVLDIDGPFRTPLSVRGFRRGASYYRLPKNAEGNFPFDPAGWHLSRKLSISGVTLERRPAYQPLFAPFHRIGTWLWAMRVIRADRSEIMQGDSPAVFVRVLLARHAGVVFEPRDLVGFRGEVDFRSEWNYRLIALVFLRHRFHTARGPGELLIRLPGAASTDTMLGQVTMIRVLNAHENLQVSAARGSWNVLLTPESVYFANGAAWLAPMRWIRSRLRQARAFLLPF